MRVLREAVRYGYAPFMMFGLTGAAYWVVANGHSIFLARAAAGHCLRNSLCRRADRTLL